MKSNINYEESCVDIFIALEDYNYASEQYDSEIQNSAICEALLIEDPVEEGIGEGVKTGLNKIYKFFHDLRMKFVKFVKAFIQKVKNFFKKKKNESSSEDPSVSTTAMAEVPKKETEKYQDIIEKCQEISSTAEEVDDQLSEAMKNPEIAASDVKLLKAKSDSSAKEMNRAIALIQNTAMVDVKSTDSERGNANLTPYVKGGSDLAQKSAERVLASNPIKLALPESSEKYEIAKASADGIVKMGIVMKQNGESLPGSVGSVQKAGILKHKANSFFKSKDGNRKKIALMIVKIIEAGDTSAALQAYNYAKKNIMGDLAKKYDEYLYNKTYKSVLSRNGGDKEDAKWIAAKAEFQSTCSQKGLANLLKLAKSRK